MPAALPVDFFKGESRRYRSRIHRADGVVVELDGGSYNHIGGRVGELPHDAAHLIVEAGLGLDRGVWGTIAAGGLFRHTTVVAGRQRPHAGSRGRSLARDAHVPIMQAEAFTGAVCAVMLTGRTPRPERVRRALDDRLWTPAATAEALEAIATRLQQVARAWRSLGAGEPLRLEWPAGAPARR
jgi:hypothetical protein